MDVALNLIQPAAVFIVFGILLLVCIYGWFTSTLRYMSRPTTFSWTPEAPTEGDRPS